MSLFLLITLAHGNLSRTGRHGESRSTVSDGVKYLCVQLGGKGDKPGDLHMKFDKDFHVLGFRSHARLNAQYPSEDTKISFSGALPSFAGAMFYEATRSLSRGASAGTDVLLAASLPSGVQASAQGNVRRSGGLHHEATLETLTAFHTAGPLNFEASKLVSSNRVRLKLGRGGRYNGCPVSLQSEFEPGHGGPADYELGLRHKFDETGQRRLRARVLMPGSKVHSAWVEYQDRAIDDDGVWYAKVAMPLSGDGMRKPELSLRRAWQW